jgi:hypothetical protein
MQQNIYASKKEKNTGKIALHGKITLYRNRFGFVVFKIWRFEVEVGRSTKMGK